MGKFVKKKKKKKISAGKIVLLVLPDKKVETVKEVIHDMIGPLDGPNKGVLFTLPIAYSEGVAED